MVVLGFIIRLAIPKNYGCTLIGCSCDGVSGEIPCNTCIGDNTIFIMGIFNVIQQCNAKEIIMCEDNVQINKRIDFENENCKTKFYFL